MHGLRLLLSSVSLFFLQATAQVPGPSIAFIGDTQAPLWIEDLFLESHNNAAATQRLLDDLEARQPARLCFLGDVVNMGWRNDRWAGVDSALFRLRRSGCNVQGCLGNHELMTRAAEGERNFQLRFPDHVSTGYVVTGDSLATILLNSNFGKMTSSQVATQQAWYEQMIQHLDSQPGIRAVIVACHHPPFSDSKLVGSSVEVQNRFVAPYLRSAKCRLFVTGHAHLFQHMVVDGKDFVVAGGGGGLQHPMKKKIDGPVDRSGSYKPLFQYLTVSLHAGQMEVTSYRLSDDYLRVEKGYAFTIPVHAGMH